ncbi:hypothetical protein [Enterobacter dykesii]|uniref:hypothetical protein n=1 Tax=Enterobacter dykesii TaxID=2797506 RepID=UPI0032B4BBA3
MDEMIKHKAGTLVIEIPEVMIVDGEELRFSSSDLEPVYADGADPYEDDPIGFNLVHEVPGHGTVNNGIYVDQWGEVQVLSGPLNEQDEYEHPDDCPVDTYFEPPRSFTEQVNVYHDDGEEDDRNEDDV